MEVGTPLACSALSAQLLSKRHPFIYTCVVPLGPCVGLYPFAALVIPTVCTQNIFVLRSNSKKSAMEYDTLNGKLT